MSRAADRPETVLLHATCVALGGRGVLLRGSSGSGKSDLALRLIDHPGHGVGEQLMRGELVGDDQIILSRHDNSVIASPAEQLAGLLEIRGIGIVSCPYVDNIPVRLVVELVQQQDIERMPDAREAHREVLGLQIPSMEIDATQPSAAARVRAALQSVCT